MAVRNAHAAVAPEAGLPGEADDRAAIDSGYREVVRQLYLAYWNRWMSAVTDAEKSSAALILRSGLNAARAARDQALSVLVR